MPNQYRPCAGSIVFNSAGKVLLCSRIDIPGEHWQFPQGGIESGETPEIAAKRELFEETSIISVVLVSTDDKPHRYTFPTEIQQRFQQKGISTIGQDIYFSLFFFNGKDTEINLNTEHPEFDKYLWSDLEFAVQNIVSFKKSVYQALSVRFGPKIQQYLNNIS